MKNCTISLFRPWFDEVTLTFKSRALISKTFDSDSGAAAIHSGSPIPALFVSVPEENLALASQNEKKIKIIKKTKIAFTRDILGKRHQFFL